MAVLSSSATSTSSGLQNSLAPPLRIQVLTGADAWALLEDPGFQERWRDLAGTCPWATVFQLPEFVCTWYRIFAAKYSTVIVVGSAVNGQVDGLLTLACSGDGKDL